MQEFGETPKLRCSVCANLSEEVKKHRKAKIVRKKFRTKHTVRFKSFIAKDGVVSKHFQKMFSHKHRVIILGRDHKKRHRYVHVRMHDHIAKLEWDFAEIFSAAPHFEQRFQKFQMDTSLGIECITGGGTHK